MFLYNLGIYLYLLLIKIVSPFKTKAKFWLKGRKNIFQKLEQAFADNEKPVIWFHTASLGEFEQGRPLIEKIKEKHPNLKILLTFFSPSGYEVRKNYDKADFIFYLPLDTPKNARKFLNIVKPSMVFFVKYEFWYYILREVQRREIPLFLFSAIFRKQQVFFRKKNNAFQKLLQEYTHIFVQNQESLELLENIEVRQASIAGDTRFDRVKDIDAHKKQIEIAEKFKNNTKALVVGSSWGADFQLLYPFINQFEQPLKVIIAPHEIKNSEIEKMQHLLTKKSVRYSQVQMENVSDFEVLIIDNVGMLSSLYQYGDFAYVGGAFGSGLHNILEPATFGMPIFFGAKYHKFQEAKDLVDLQGAFSVRNTQEFAKLFTAFYEDENNWKKTVEITKNYVLDNTGGTQKVYQKFLEYL